MQYGHAQDNAFPATGAGSNTESSGNFGAISESPLLEEKLDRDQRSLGNKVINFNEPSESQTENISEELESGPKLGEVIDINPIKREPKNDDPEPAKIIEASFDRIKTDKVLSSSGVETVERDIIKKFDKDGNAESFYRAARDAMEVNLDNSYNRKLAA